MLATDKYDYKLHLQTVDSKTCTSFISQIVALVYYMLPSTVRGKFLHEPSSNLMGPAFYSIVSAFPASSLPLGFACTRRVHCSVAPNLREIAAAYGARPRGARLIHAYLPCTPPLHAS